MCAPIGPVGLLCVRRTLLAGPIAGLVSLLGTSLADGFYCAVAGLGVTFISHVLTKHKLFFQLLGALILVLLGIRIFFSASNGKKSLSERNGLMEAFASTFVLTLSNPMLVIVFMAVFTALGVHGWWADFSPTALLVMGVFSGSASWAPVLAIVGSVFRPQLNAYHVRIINRYSGAIMMTFGFVLGIMSIMR